MQVNNFLLYSMLYRSVAHR